MCSRSPQNFEFGYLTLLFGPARWRNVPKFITSCRAFVFLIISYCFVTFSLPSPYSSFLNSLFLATTTEVFPPPPPPIVEINLSKQVLNVKDTYELPFKVTVESKLRSFQFKIIHNIIPTNLSLYKMNIKEKPQCEHCLFQNENLVHVFLSAL